MCRSYDFRFGAIARWTLALVILSPCCGAIAAPLELANRERMVWVGNALVERSQSQSYIELCLTCLAPERDWTFRNLGWSGDTVFGDARAGFDTAAEGFARLLEQVRAARPSVILVAYGGNEAVDGAEGLSRFRQGLNRLLDELTPLDARIVLVTPLRHEDLGPPLSEPRDINESLSEYALAIRGLAERRKLEVLDLFEAMPMARRPRDWPLTSDGMHLSPLGYWVAGHVVSEQLGLSMQPWRVDLQAGGETVEVQGATVTDVASSDDGLSFVVEDHQLLPPISPGPSPTLGSRRIVPIEIDIVRKYARPDHRLRVQGLSSGTYQLRVDEQTLLEADAEAFQRGVSVIGGPISEQLSAIEREVVWKNELFFHRWRPQNDTYLFGFRKHEQGQNAVEVPQFDLLVAECEERIAQLRAHRKHRYEIRRVTEETR